MRSAWLAALFSGDGVATFHDVESYGGLSAALAYGPTHGVTVGICDPSAASVWPEKALREFYECPIVYIERPGWRASAKRVFPDVSDAWCDLSEKQSAWFKQHSRMVVQYDQLDDFDTVARIYWCCTDRKLSRQKFELFRFLNVQQDTRRVMNIINNIKRFA
jgi:hypothetical protein